jgi:fatty acid desaturase
MINIILFGLIIFLYSSFLGVYFSYLFIRALLISSTDNLPHYGANLDNIDGAFNLKTPVIWQKMILNFNFHKVHHKYPNVPWNVLPSKFIAEQGSFDQLYFKTYFKQWLGVIDKEILNRSKS